jgi:hypothetical protein
MSFQVRQEGGGRGGMCILNARDLGLNGQPTYKIPSSIPHLPRLMTRFRRHGFWGGYSRIFRLSGCLASKKFRPTGMLVQHIPSSRRFYDFCACCADRGIQFLPSFETPADSASK